MPRPVNVPVRHPDLGVHYVPEQVASSWAAEGWEPVAPAELAPPPPPALTASRKAWREYAAAAGIDPDLVSTSEGREQLITAHAAAAATGADDDTSAPVDGHPAAEPTAPVGGNHPEGS